MGGLLCVGGACAYPPHLEPFSRDPNQVVILRPFHAEPDGVLQEREKGGGGEAGDYK